MSVKLSHRTVIVLLVILVAASALRVMHVSPSRVSICTAALVVCAAR